MRAIIYFLHYSGGLEWAIISIRSTIRRLKMFFHSSGSSSSTINVKRNDSVKLRATTLQMISMTIPPEMKLII